MRGLIILTCLGLAACAPDTATRLQSDPLTPPGVASRGVTVDPIVVGDRLMQSGEYELALQAYARGVDDTGPSPELAHAIASANLRLGRLNQAERSLRALLDADPDNAHLWNDLGVALIERNEYGEAARVFRQAFALDSGDSPEIRENLRIALAKMENPSYSAPEKEAFRLVSRGNGVYTLSENTP